jgi:ATP-dependent protease ClpP protease subunit
MNKRRRDILAALVPALEFAHQQTPNPPRALADVPGLHVKATASGAELMIYGPIGGGMFDMGISAADVAAALREAGPGPIDVRLNSPGGDVFQGVAIHTMLARHAGVVTVHVDGLAASAASFIMLAGDRIVMARNAMVMIHDGMTGSYGNGATLRRAADLLDKVSASIADMYAERAGEDPEHWRNLMTVNAEDGTWFTGEEAHAAGLVDALTETPDEDENDQVWDRLANWTDRLPSALAEKVSAHVKPVGGIIPAAEPKMTCRACGTDVGGDCPPECELMQPAVLDRDEDFAHRMRMWAWMNDQQIGHLAGEDKANA